MFISVFTKLFLQSRFCQTNPLIALKWEYNLEYSVNFDHGNGSNISVDFLGKRLDTIFSHICPSYLRQKTINYKNSHSSFQILVSPLKIILSPLTKTIEKYIKQE